MYITLSYIASQDVMAALKGIDGEEEEKKEAEKEEVKEEEPAEEEDDENKTPGVYTVDPLFYSPLF